MSNTELISVVMPAYNAESYIEEALNSILEQTYRNVELIVADDASTDNTRAIIDSFAERDNRVITAHNDVNLGYLKTCNKLKSMATGEFITFQDSDDYSDRNRLQILYDHFASNPNVDVVGSNFSKVMEDGSITWQSDYPTTHEDIVASMPQDFLFCGATFMLRKKVHQEVGGYNEFFDRAGAEDFYWVYLISEKFRICTVSDQLYFYRFNPKSVSSTVENKKKLFSVDIARFLIRQRINTATDALESGNLLEIEDEMARLNRPFELDKLLFKKKQIKRLLWNGQYPTAYKMAFGIIFRNPFQSTEFYKDLYIYLPRWIKS